MMHNSLLGILSNVSIKMTYFQGGSHTYRCDGCNDVFRAGKPVDFYRSLQTSFEYLFPNQRHEEDGVQNSSVA